MGINITHTMNTSQFENKENLRNAAKNLLNRQGTSKEAMNKIIEQTVFDSNKAVKEIYTNPQLSIIKASSQITANNSLKETLKYLKRHANKKQVKTPILGELWNLTAKSREENSFNSDIYEFKIDFNAENIFAA